MFACSCQTDSPRRSFREGTSITLSSPFGRFGDSAAPAGARISSTVIDARPAALVNGVVVEWGELRPLLNEAAGAEVLQEIILDRMLSRALADAGVTITADEVDAERQLFYSTLSPDTGVSARLGRELRSSRGIHRHRFAQLLHRNASLRALVRDRVQVTDEAVGRLYEIIHGPKRQARLMVLPTLRAADAAIQRVRSGEFFGDVAVEISTDSSASRGGLLEPISRADPSYPQALRQVLWSLASAEISAPVLLGDTYALLMLVREVPGDGADLDEQRGELERLARLNQQRLLMDQVARRLILQATVTVFDEALRESWDSRFHRGASLGP
ncbi:MAG: peptidylprolyl isomerase [Planctomycetota bacterium]|nr:peptidylprolyl isomerase [Planctomycetota bacterium]